MLGALYIGNLYRCLRTLFWSQVNVFCQIATPASEIDGEGIRTDLEASAAPMDSDDMVTTGNISQSSTPTPDEHQKQSPDADGGQEAGHVEADPEAEVDVEAVG